MANKILAIDPSGTGTTGIFYTNGQEQEFKENKGKDWKEHYEFIISLVKAYKPNLLLYENTNFISNRTSDSLNLIRLLGALECLNVKQVNSVNVFKVKEMSKALFAGKVKIEHLEYLPGRGKGWIWKGQRVSIHQLEAFIVYYLYVRQYLLKTLDKALRNYKNSIYIFIMTWPKILFGMLIGISASSYHHQKQLNKERQVFIECQAAWEKYYSLTKPTNQIAQPITNNQSFWQLILQSSLKIAQTKVQEFNQPFTNEQEKYLVYHYEVLPKCQQLKQWKKHMKTFSKS